MRIAFAIVSLFPGGGLQRDCVEIARLIRDQGHDVAIYTSRIHDYMLADELPILLLQNDAITNHQRQYRFAVDFLRETSDRYDLLVGFDKLLGLDVLYCADPSMGYRLMKRPYLNFLPRYRTYSRMEGDSFAPSRKTKTILLSQNQRIEYVRAWGTEQARMTLVPPTLTVARRQPESRFNGVREKIRSHLGLANDAWVWISVGVQPKTKGIDRVIDALPNFPDAKFLIVGLNETNDISGKLARRARTLGVSSRVKWLGHREDISHVMAAADLLVHPARYDTTGTVILEAVVNGLPVVASAACGYAHHVGAANAGFVVQEPFEFGVFLTALREARDPAVRDAWSAAGVEYGENPWLYKGQLRASQIIIETAYQKRRNWSDTVNVGLLPPGGDEQPDGLVSSPAPGSATVQVTWSDEQYFTLVPRE
jgi:UDP-glucose:(heptosyl)LPS alpha-1,3-glucosyltransferase